MFGGKGGTWETERAVRLRGIYFLEQGSTESTVPAGSARAACLLVESTEQILFPVFHAIPPAESRALRRERFDLICSLSSQVPCHFLRLGLEGPFWNKIEETIGTGTFFCAHRGSSMNPTLSAEDALEVEPHSDALREGDVILCRPRDQEDAVVHRVTRITSDGIRTRGDNSSGDDPWLLRREDVSGRVVAAWRGEKRRSVPGGTRGRLAAGIARGRKALDRGLRPALRPLYLSASRGAPAGRLLPERYRPRVVRFNAGGESRRRVLIGQRVVGSYSEERREWMIRRPWRLFVDVTRLPPE
jgi:signal peptidase I